MSPVPPTQITSVQGKVSVRSASCALTVQPKTKKQLAHQCCLMSFIFYLIVLFQNVAEPLSLCKHCTGTYVATEHVIGQQLFSREKATVLQPTIGSNTAWT